MSLNWKVLRNKSNAFRLIREVYTLYETILGKKLDQRNFVKKLVTLALGLIKKLDEQRAIGPHRPPSLYQFEKETYEAALERGIVQTY